MERAAPMADRAGRGPARNELGARERSPKRCLVHRALGWVGLALRDGDIRWEHRVADQPARQQSRPAGFHAACKRRRTLSRAAPRSPTGAKLRAIDAHARWRRWTGNLPEGNAEPICSASARSASSSPSTGSRTRSTRIAARRLKVDAELDQLFQDVKTLDSFDATASRLICELSAKPWTRAVRNASDALRNRRSCSCSCSICLSFRRTSTRSSSSRRSRELSR